MKCLFINNNQIIEVDVIEWLSLLELGKENGLKIQDDYSPTRALLNKSGQQKVGHPIQSVTKDSAEEIANSFERVLQMIQSKTNNRIKKNTNLTQKRMIKDGRKSYAMGIFLGIYKGTAYFTGDLYTLEYFCGKNLKKIQELIEFCQVGEFEINWTPIME